VVKETEWSRFDTACPTVIGAVMAWRYDARGAQWSARRAADTSVGDGLTP
jgi:hypothetical protein